MATNGEVASTPASSTVRSSPSLRSGIEANCEVTFHGRWSRLKNTSVLSIGGKMRAKALLATAPTREMRSPRSGTANAKAAALGTVV